MRTAHDRRAVPADDLDAIGRTFAAGGAVHVTAALPPELLAVVREAAGGVLRSWADAAAAGLLEAELAGALERGYVPLTRLPLAAQQIGALLHPSFRALARSYLEKEPEVEPNSHVRSIVLDRSDAHLPFHQDETILQRRLMNVWIPLDPCGVHAPGLEVVWGSWNELVEPAPSDDAKFPVERARLDPDAVRRRFGSEAYWHPEFGAGDAMLFSGATVHRTYVTKAMTANRMSAEIRLL